MSACKGSGLIHCSSEQGNKEVEPIRRSKGTNRSDKEGRRLRLQRYFGARPCRENERETEAYRHTYTETERERYINYSYYALRPGGYNRMKKDCDWLSTVKMQPCQHSIMHCLLKLALSVIKMEMVIFVNDWLHELASHLLHTRLLREILLVHL